jgi:hypothetical protein
MVGDPYRATNKQFLINQDLRQVIRRVRDQSVRIQVSEINEYVGNRSPMEQLLVSLQQGVEVQPSELLERDRA